jgi:DMSO/TMAO reductase YedYZ molybdopterin-dependent catalytic subunit
LGTADVRATGRRRTLVVVDVPVPAEVADPPTDPPEDRPVGRRALLGMLGLGTLGVLWGADVQSAIERAILPITIKDRTGLTGLLPSTGRFRIYTVTGSLPERADADYRLSVTGAVDRPAELDIDDVRVRLPQTSLTRDFQCVTGWRVEDVPWQGVKVADVLDEVGAHADATHVRFRSFDGVYTETLTIDQARRDDVLVAHRMLGGPVTREHGGPVRLYVAPMYGYKSLKWLDRIEVATALDDPSDPGYWENLGYDTDAWVGSSNGRAGDTPT